MKVTKWLTIHADGGARITAKRPALSPHEVAILLKIDLPDALFRRPRLEAKVTIPDEAAVNETINAVVAENVKEAIEQATGLTFSVCVKQPGDTP